MSKFIKNIKNVFEFDGDTITVELSCISRVDFLKLAPHSPDGGKDAEVTLINLASEMLPRYVSKFEGLSDASGNALTLDDALCEIYFMPLISDIIKFWLDSSTVQDEKK